jgi:hypothetical protein
VSLQPLADVDTAQQLSITRLLCGAHTSTLAGLSTLAPAFRQAALYVIIVVQCRLKGSTQTGWCGSSHAITSKQAARLIAVCFLPWLCSSTQSSSSKSSSSSSSTAAKNVAAGIGRELCRQYDLTKGLTPAQLAGVKFTTCCCSSGSDGSSAVAAAGAAAASFVQRFQPSGPIPGVWARQLYARVPQWLACASMQHVGLHHL